ncbi:MAG: hypothetical protein Q8S09_01580 [Hyphomonas sp.]|nr:hypothetical protein [Hyphomonas sp.]
MTEILRPATASVTAANVNSPAIRKSGASGMVALFSLIGLIGLIVVSVLNIARIGYTYLTVYPVTARSITDPEPVRWAASNYGITHLVNFANASLDPTDRIFSFRQSDLAYYADNPIAVYTDNRYAPLFRLRSSEALKQALLKEHIRFIALPPYGLAEVNNSAFVKLIADPKMARLVFDQDGDRLFELIDQQNGERRMEPVRVVDMRSKAERNKWNATMMPLPLSVSVRTSQARLNRDEAGVTLRRDRQLIASDELEDVLQPWDLSMEATPSLVGRSEFEVRDGQYSFEGHIEGDGLVNLYVEFHASAPGEQARRERKILWSGVLNDSSQEIGGQFNVLFGSNAVEGSGSNRLSARVFFGLKQGGYLTVQSLAIRRMANTGDLSDLEAKQAKDFQSLRRAYRDGWKNLKATTGAGLYSEPFDVFGMDERGVIVARQTSGDSRAFTSPTFFLPTDLLTLDSAFRLERTAEGVKPIVEVSMRPSGNGLMSITVAGTCLGELSTAKTDEQKELEKELSAIEPEHKAKGVKFAATLPSVSLRLDGRVYRESVVLECTPASITTIFGITGDRLKSPPDLRMGEARISGFDLSLKAWTGAREISAIPLVRSSDVQAPLVAPPAMRLPEHGG